MGMLFIYCLQKQHYPLCLAPGQVLQVAANTGPLASAFLVAQNPLSVPLNFLGSREDSLGCQHHHYNQTAVDSFQLPSQGLSPHPRLAASL